ncbi:MAG: tol-pal system protein YbgF [Hyphomicrobiaceae bacterium]|nr:tol-pal system protein YbgF [Hyphomicrobiaceae bacterium]
MTSFTNSADLFQRLRRLAAGTLALALLAAPLTFAQDAFAQDAKSAKAKAAGQPGDAGLKARVESLEEQLVDMQVLVGTLQSMARNPVAPAAAGGGGGGADPIRVDALENQVRALSNQVQALSDQIRSMGGAPRRGEYVAPSAGAAQAASSFGTTSVHNDAIGGLIEQGNASGPPVITGDNGYASQPAADAASPAGVQTAALPAAGEAGDPRQAYETAYGYLLQRDYGAAEAAFGDFLKKFPSDSLAGNAQYWLGETYFVRGQYKSAASAFLQGYQTYAKSAKAPDSLLKLAMSLDRLGQKDAACASYSELNSKFPDAPQSVKARAQAERQRVGCQ